MTRPLSVTEYAELRHVSPEAIRAAIRRKDLRAQVINPNARRKTYRITAKAAADFEARCQL